MNTKRQRQGERTPRSVPAALAGADVLSAEGDRMRVESLWVKRPVVLAFVRHFG